MNLSEGYRIRECSNQFGKVVWLGEKTRSENGSNKAPFPVTSLFKPSVKSLLLSLSCGSRALQYRQLPSGNTLPAPLSRNRSRLVRAAERGAFLRGIF